MPVSTPSRATIEPDDHVLTLAWWYSWWRVALIAAGVTVALIAAGGLIVRAQRPGPGSPDAGFLQDMRTHHDQAIFMSMTYMTKPGVDPLLRTMAGETVTGQSFETGQMVELLRAMHAEEENSGATAMAWMGMAVAPEQMPGMATPAQLEALAAADGAAADELFVQLMTAHHEGGIHMAEGVEGRAESSRVHDLAARMAANQRTEITEMSAALDKSKAA